MREYKSRSNKLRMRVFLEYLQAMLACCRRANLDRMRHKHKKKEEIRRRECELGEIVAGAEGGNDVDDGEEEVCSICLESVLTKVVEGGNEMLGCGHVFHKSCVAEWYKSGGRRTKKCPVCRFHVGMSCDE